jgi:hypothetical protein
MFKIIILITKYKKISNLTQKSEPLINQLLRRGVRRVLLGLIKGDSIDQPYSRAILADCSVQTPSQL